jgi:adenosylhomocysteinase
VRRGIALRAKGHGAQVIVTEVDPLRALEATMDGYRVMPLLEAAPQSDFIVTATGDKHVVDQEHLEVLKDGCVLANSGHFNVEINIPALERMAVEKHGRAPRWRNTAWPTAGASACWRKAAWSTWRRPRASLCGDGHELRQPGCVPCTSPAGSSPWRTACTRCREIDREVARLKLAAMGVAIDELTAEQARYLSSWRKAPETQATRRHESADTHAAHAG